MKRKIRTIRLWVNDNKAIFIAIMILLFCFGIMDRLIELINSSLLIITDIKRNLWIDLFFIVLTIYTYVLLYDLWISKHKTVTARTVGLLIVPTVLYLYFRILPDSPYQYPAYWNGPITYIDSFLLPVIILFSLYVYQQFEIKQTSANDSIYKFRTDTPISKHMDDMFNMGSLVTRIVNYIAFTDVKESAFSIGLTGEWGDGKTSLMKLIEEEIKKSHQDFIVIHFNPRKSKKADFIQEDFLESIKENLSKYHAGIDHTIDKYAVSLDIIPNLPPLLLKIMEFLRISFDKERDIQYDKLTRAINDINRRIVILIDDLDRLTGEELVEVMKVIGTNGAFPNMVFLTSFDKCYVNTVLNNYLNLGIQQRNYTDKYFTVEVRVPLHPSFRMLNYLISIFVSACKNGFILLDHSQIEQRTRNLSKYIIHRLHTIRDVKRFANQFLYDYAEIQKDVDFGDYLLLEMIKYKYPEDFEALYRFRYIHRGQASMLTPSSNDLLYINKELLPEKEVGGNESTGAKVYPKSIDLLMALFPSEADYNNWYQGRYQRIYSVSSFEHYFYNYEYAHLKADDIDSLYSAETLIEACKILDSWANYAKDVETYMLTYDISSVNDEIRLRRYMQLLLYAGYKFTSMNYKAHEFAFVRREDVESMITNGQFRSISDYKSWLIESLNELNNINPMISSNYIRTVIGVTFDNNIEPNLFVMTLDELQDYALELLDNYLRGIDSIGWDVNNAYYLAQIQKEKKGGFLPKAMKLLHDSIINNFHMYSASLPFFAEDGMGACVGYTLRFNFSSVFENKDEFENLIFATKYDSADQIELVRAIWPLYKANDYNAVPLPDGFTIEMAKSSLLKPLLDNLYEYDSINQEIDSIADEWKKGHCLADVDLFTRKAEDIIRRLKLIRLELNKKEEYTIQLEDMINVFQNYSKTARDLNEDTLRVGDLVRMRENIFKNYYSTKQMNIIYSENVFTIINISSDGQIMTKESNIPLSVTEIEALLIDGIEDAIVYYDPKLMATVVGPNDEVPSFNVDYSYFMEHFKRCITGNTSFYDLVKKRGFQFVHEVQHWLRDEFHDDGLKANHTLR